MVGRPWLLAAVFLVVAGDCSTEKQQHERRRLADQRRQLAAADHKIWRGRLPHGIRRKYILVHIPKGSGVSFLKDSPNHMPVGSTCTGSHEKALLDPAPQSYLHRNRGAQPVILLRHPIKLAYSQFIMAKCYYFKKQVRVDQTRFGDVPCKPAVAGLDQWVAGLTAQLELNRTDAFINSHGSYNPIDVQSRYVSTDVSAWRVKRSDVPADLTKAKLRLARSFGFVGIVDLYPESLCLFRFHATKGLPDYCSCDATAKPPILTNETHDLPAHSLADLDEKLQRRVAKLVQTDIQLYAHALDIFLIQIKRAENGTNLSCYRDKVAALRLGLETQFPDLVTSIVSPAASPAADRSIFDVLHPPPPPASLPPTSLDDAGRNMFDALHPPPPSPDDVGHSLFHLLHPPPPPPPSPDHDPPLAPPQ